MVEYLSTWAFTVGTTSGTAHNWVYQPGAVGTYGSNWIGTSGQWVYSHAFSTTTNTISNIALADYGAEVNRQWDQARRDRINAAAMESARVEARARREADETAEALLTRFLDAQQRKEWAERREIHVVAQSGKRYCIDGTRQMHNIFEMFQDRRIRELCVYAPNVPLADNVLTQMLMLMHAEEYLRKSANIFELARIGEPVPIAVVQEVAVDPQQLEVAA